MPLPGVDLGPALLYQNVEKKRNKPRTGETLFAAFILVALAVATLEKPQTRQTKSYQVPPTSSTVDRL
jgi:hypothetical protein